MSRPTPLLSGDGESTKTIMMRLTPAERDMILEYRKRGSLAIGQALQQGHQVAPDVRVPDRFVSGPSLFAHASVFRIGGGDYAAVGGDQNIGVPVNTDERPETSSDNDCDPTSPDSQALEPFVPAAPPTTVTMFSHTKDFHIGGGDFVATGNNHNVYHVNMSRYPGAATNRSPHSRNTVTRTLQPLVHRTNVRRTNALVSGPSVFANASNIEISEGTVMAPGSMSAVGGNQTIYR